MFSNIKEDKEKESEANINLRETLKEKTSECDLLKETIEQMKAEIELKRVVDEQCALEFVDLPSLSVELNKKLAMLPSHQPMPDTILTKKYEDLLAAHEDIKKLIAKEDFRQKLVNTEERMKTLEANNSEWEVWHQALKKELASEGMGDMRDLTFEEFFEQNERFFTIVQQGPKGDYQEDLVSTAINLENVVIVRREKMAKKKKMQEFLFQPWTKYCKCSWCRNQ
ncbi:hypothetical protein GIB67_026498 [Kingdonia uniflora]|uniref:Uncharacterized protein n=1 Tax=Kingdonia uniflora TaxID=39325 RepID=A0A7J7PBJ4_9MAGN|nr:hypothetical protein GIB67_026498 [Kingdonia uniflora]